MAQTGQNPSSPLPQSRHGYLLRSVRSTYGIPPAECTPDVLIPFLPRGQYWIEFLKDCCLPHIVPQVFSPVGLTRFSDIRWIEPPPSWKYRFLPPSVLM